MKKILINSILAAGCFCLSTAQASEVMLNKFFEQITTLEAKFDQTVVDETGFTLSLIHI